MSSCFGFLAIVASAVFASQVAVAIAADSDPADKRASRLPIYIGTGTSGASKGIYLTQFNPADGSLSSAELVAELRNPTFLAVHPARPLLLASSELGAAGKDAQTMSAYAIDPKDGKLTLLNRRQSASHSECHLAIDRSGKFVIATSYSDGTVTCLPIEADGRFGEPVCVVRHSGSSVTPRRQASARAHGVTFDAANRFAFIADLGLDRIMIYRFDSTTGKLTPNDPPSVEMAPGAGPRHFVFHPNGRFGYVINEIDSTITAMTYNADRGALEIVQTVPTLPVEYPRDKNSTAEIACHPSGKFLYGSNRGHNSIAAFAVDEATGKLNLIGHESTQGKTPRNFMVDPSGGFLLAANQDSNNIVVFRIDAASGKLQPTGKTLAAPMPMCLVPAAR